jgi:Raf kinase inhibitor-like YbhB/YbcL family protein
MHRRASLTAGLAVAFVLAGCAGSGSSASAAVPSSAAPVSASPSDSEAAMSPSSSPSTAGTLALTSSAFQPGAAIPAKYGCQGADVSPPLAWSGVPSGATSLAIILTDPDARDFVHWVAWGIDPASGGLAEGAGAPGASDLTAGSNSFGKTGYGGPCPPSGTHHYVFELLALDQALSLNAGASADQLRAAANGHTVATTTLIGTYTHG